MHNAWFRYLFFPLLFAGSIAAAHLVPGIDGSDIERHIRDTLHVIGFAGVAWLIFELASFGRLGKALLAFVGTIALGAVAELGQRLAGYTFNEADIVRDALGAALIISARLLWTQGTSRMTRVTFRLLATVVALAVFAPFSYWSWGILSERLKAPVVMDFEGAYADHYFSATNSDVVLTNGDAVDSETNDRFLRVMLTRAPRSGVLISTALYDWRDYEWLVFDARIASGADSEVSVHINDYDGLGHFADVPAGMVTVTGADVSHRIAIREVFRQTGRTEEVDDIRQIAIFARSRNRGAEMHIDNLRLE